MASLIGFLNRLLPFATPGAPLWQDLIHLATICGALYFAPQIQEWYKHRQAAQDPAPDDQVHHEDHGIVAPGDNIHEAQRDGANANALPPNHEDADQLQGGADDDVGGQEGMGGHGDHVEAAQPGPANIQDAPAQRNVGAKKAKSLARKDQRRAYHEFQRSQGEAQRARDAEGAAEREATLAAERERRRAAEAKLEEKKAREREVKREQDRKAREQDARRREMVVRLVRDGLDDSRMVDLWKVTKQVGGDVDEEWVEKILKGSGLLGRKGDIMTVVTGMGWCVRVSAEDMMRVYEMAMEDGSTDRSGKVGLADVGGVLQQVLAR